MSGAAQGMVLANEGMLEELGKCSQHRLSITAIDCAKQSANALLNNRVIHHWPPRSIVELMFSIECNKATFIWRAMRRQCKGLPAWSMNIPINRSPASPHKKMSELVTLGQILRKIQLELRSLRQEPHAKRHWRGCCLTSSALIVNVHEQLITVRHSHAALYP
jgi:hypothetical protein